MKDSVGILIAGIAFGAIAYGTVDYSVSKAQRDREASQVVDHTADYVDPVIPDDADPTPTPPPVLTDEEIRQGYYVSGRNVRLLYFGLTESAAHEQFVAGDLKYLESRGYTYGQENTNVIQEMPVDEDTMRAFGVVEFPTFIAVRRGGPAGRITGTYDWREIVNCIYGYKVVSDHKPLTYQSLTYQPAVYHSFQQSQASC